jgi:hypothetical protein
MKPLRFILASVVLFTGLASAQAQTGIADLVVARKVNLQGNASPPALAADANDYAPAGMTNATFLRLSSTVPVNISGLAGGTHGRTLWIINVGTSNLTLLDQSTLSVAANRFSFGGPVIVPPGNAISIWYDGQTALRWVGLVTGKSTTSWGGITGTLTNQTDLNNQLAIQAQAALTTGVVDEDDTVLLSAPNATTLRIAALQHGVFAQLLGVGLPVSTAFKSFAQQDYALSGLGLVADGTYARWIGYNSSGSVVASAQPFVNDDTIIQLGAVVLKRVGGVTSFIDDGGPRSFATLPSMAGFSELERTFLTFRSTVTVKNASTNMTLARSAGVIQGMSINWTGVGGKNSLDQIAGTGVSFIQINPATAAGTALPGTVTVLTATNYWNGSISTPLANNTNSSVKRILLGIKGGLFIQEGEAQYTTVDDGVANVSIAPFSTLLAQDLFIEIGRIVVRKNATDLSDPAQARFFVTGTGAGGSSGGSPSAVTSINGTSGEINANSPVGAVTLSLPNALVFTGKTIAQGTFNSPTLVTPALGTPASGVMTNVTGTALGLTAGNVVTNANLTGDVTSAGNATTLATVTGTTGTFGSASAVPVITVNAKGLVTNVITAPVAAAAAGTLTGTTLAANVVNASLNNITPTGGNLAVNGTIGSTGRITVTNPAATNTIFLSSATTTTGANVSVWSNGGGDTILGLENSTGSFQGLPAYDFGISVPNGRGISMFMQGIGSLARFSSTGLAVTGGIDSTGPINAGPQMTINAISTNTAFLYFRNGSGANVKTRFYSDNAENFGIQVGPAFTQVANFNALGLQVTGTLTSTSNFDSGGLVSAFGTTSNGASAFKSTFAGSTYAGLDLADSTNTSGASFVAFRKSSAGVIGSITRVGTTDAVAYNTSSDLRLKTNIRDFTAKDSGRIIDGLKPRLFDWKSGGNDVIGFIAQEENAVDPALARIGAVTVGDNKPDLDPKTGKQWQRSDAALVPILVAEVKSLRSRVAALEQKQATQVPLGVATLGLGLLTIFYFRSRFDS